MDLDPAIFDVDLQGANKKLKFLKKFSAYFFWKVHLHHFSKIKSKKKSQNSRNQCFSYYFLLDDSSVYGSRGGNHKEKKSIG